MTKKIYLMSLLFILLALPLALTSCGDDNDLENNDTYDQEDLSVNEKLLNTKWTSENFDFDIADDFSWAYSFTEITNIYFYSLSEGVLYYSRKNKDTITGRSRDTFFVYFKYLIEGEVINIDAITTDYFGLPASFSYKNNKLSLNGIEFMKGEMTSGDKKGIYEKTGTTGKCQWYFDNKTGSSKLYIIGEGQMSDYETYQDTPWKDLPYQEVSIGENVTTIGSHSFCSNHLYSVIFEDYGDKLVKIGSYAFSNSYLSKLDIPDNVTIIEDGAFGGCKNGQFVLPKNVEEIGNESFLSCKFVDMSNTPKLRIIGDEALLFTSNFLFTNSKILEKIGSSAITFGGDGKNKTQLFLELPSIRELGDAAIITLCDNNKISIGNSLSKVSGTPICSDNYNTGDLHIDNSVPIALSQNFVNNPKKWNLYVPTGSESAYKQSSYWSNFNMINSEVGQGNGNIDDDNISGNGEFVTSLSIYPSIFTATVSGTLSDQAFNGSKNPIFYVKISESENFIGFYHDLTQSMKVKDKQFRLEFEYLAPNTTYYLYVIRSDNKYKSKVYSFKTSSPKVPTNCTYSIGSKQFKFVKVSGLPGGEYYIMQTELPHNSDLVFNNQSVSRPDLNDDNYVTQKEFLQFLQKLRVSTGIAFRLPTPEEWIYAAKGGQYSRGYTYSGSNNLEEVGWYKVNGKSNYTHDIAKLKPNELGLYDMSGNLGEITFPGDIGHPFWVDGDIYGGNHKSKSDDCRPESYIKHKQTSSDRFKYFGYEYAIRLVYSAY